MEKKIQRVKIYYDTKGNTLNVWFDDPQKEYISEETGEEVILNKDKRGRVIGFEKLNFLPSGSLPIETLPVDVVLNWRWDKIESMSMSHR